MASPEIQSETPIKKEKQQKVTLKVYLKKGPFGAMITWKVDSKWNYPMVTLKNTNSQHSQHSIRPGHSTKEERVKTTTSFSRVDFFRWA